MLEYLFNKVAILQDSNFIKKRLPTKMFSCGYCEFLKNTYVEEHLRTDASVGYDLNLFQNQYKDRTNSHCINFTWLKLPRLILCTKPSKKAFWFKKGLKLFLLSNKNNTSIFKLEMTAKHFDQKNHKNNF